MPTTPATPTTPASSHIDVITLFIEGSKMGALGLRQGPCTNTQGQLENAIKCAIYASSKAYKNSEDLVNDLAFFRFNLPLVCTFISQTSNVPMDALVTATPVMLIHHSRTNSIFIDILPSVSSTSVPE